MEAEPLAQELSDQDRVLLVFGYLGPLAVVSLVASRRELVKWHAKQGLVLWAAAAVGWVVLGLIQWLLDSYLWTFIGELFRAGVVLTVVGVLLVAVLCVVRGLEGERFKVPLLGELADRL